MAQGYPGHGHARLQAFLDDLGFEKFGIRSSLAHGNPEDKGDGVHVFLSGEHRPYRRDRVGDFAGRLLRRGGEGLGSVAGKPGARAEGGVRQ